jgi:hypothetical protein
VTVTDGVTIGIDLNQLNNPAGICITRDGQTLYIADDDNNRVMKWTIDDSQGSIVAGSVSGVASQTTQLLNGPGDVALDPSETYLYVLEQNNQRVQQFRFQRLFIELIISQTMKSYSFSCFCLIGMLFVYFVKHDLKKTVEVYRGRNLNFHPTGRDRHKKKEFDYLMNQIFTEITISELFVLFRKVKQMYYLINIYKTILSILSISWYSEDSDSCKCVLHIYMTCTFYIRSYFLVLHNPIKYVTCFVDMSLEKGNHHTGYMMLQ